MAAFIITHLYQDVLLTTDHVNLNAKCWTWTDDVFVNLQRMLSSQSSAVRHYINMVPRATTKLQEMPYAIEVHLDNNVSVRLSAISGNLTTVAANESRHLNGAAGNYKTTRNAIRVSSRQQHQGSFIYYLRKLDKSRNQWEKTFHM